MNSTELLALCQEAALALRGTTTAERDWLAVTLHELREARRALGDAERYIEARLVDAMDGEKTAVIGSLGMIERKSAPIKPRWEHERLLPRLAALSRDERHLDTETGVIEGEAEAALRVFFDVAAISYYRRGKLKERGLDPNDYSENEGWRTTIRITANDA